MSRRTVIFVIIVLVLIGGAAAYAFAWPHQVERLLPAEIAKKIERPAVDKDGLPLIPASAFVITTSTPSFASTVKPGEIRALYVTVYTAADAGRTQALANTVKQSGMNAMVIDIKDTNGVVHMPSSLQTLVTQLNSEGIYTIARLPVFQDKNAAQQHPDWALKFASGALWNSNGQYWLDAAGHPAWDYNIGLANEALAMGFREVNLDYVRFPSDGNLDAIRYPFYDGVTYKEYVMQDFFKYFSSAVHSAHPNAVVSADLFADSFLRDYDVGIGQRLKLIAPYLDVVAPMVYPSHYAKGNFGFPNPATEPYQVVLQTLQNGKATLASVSSTVTVRPWIQAFDLGAPYTPAMVHAEMKAIQDAGYHSGWMAWNPSNVYSTAALSEPNN
jgi:hypothetical protein